MQMLKRRDANALRRSLTQQQPGQSGLGDYGGAFDDYSEKDVFRSTDNPGGPLQLMANGQPAPDPYYNPISYTTYAFAVSNTSGNNGSVQILSTNNRRQFLLVQNLSSSADMWVNFGSNALPNACVKLTQGTGLFFDEAVPNNSVFIFFAAATNEPGILIEGAPIY